MGFRNFIKKQYIIDIATINLYFYFFLFLISITFLFIFNSSFAYSQEKTELTLFQCLNIALERNPAINSARENLSKSKLLEREAYSSILPTLTTNLEYTHTDINIKSDPGSNSDINIKSDPGSNSQPEDNYSFTIELTQPLYDKGIFFTKKEQAYLSIDSSILDLDREKQVILSDVISAYLNILKAQEMIAIAEESKDRLVEHLKVTKRRFEVGYIAKNDVLRAEMELANAESELIHTQMNLALTHENLQSLLLMEEESFAALPLTLNWKEEDDVKKLLNIAYENRPDYLKVIKNKSLAEKGITLAKKEFLPDISLFGRYIKKGENFFPDDRETIIGGRINLPIFEGGIRAVKLRRARYDLSLAEYQEIELKRQIRAETIMQSKSRY